MFSMRLILIFLSVGFASSALAQVSVIVPGTSCPWLAGMPDGTVTRTGELAPQLSAVKVQGLELVEGYILSFNATGLTGNNGNAVDGPDGRLWENYIVSREGGAEFGIGDISTRIDALVGVFLSDETPISSPEPSALDFGTLESTNFTTFRPLLKQVFFVGDGYNDAGVKQSIIVPQGATRLFLGVMDAQGWGNNAGFFDVTVDIRPASGTSFSVSGAVFLPSALNSVQPIDFTFRPTTGAVFTRTVTLDATGGYSIPNIPSGSYVVSIKGAKWLRKNIAVNVGAANVTNANTSLKAGDASNDNFADITDLLLLVSAYNKVSPSSDYSEAADFTCDGNNDIADLLLLIANFNQQGDL